MPLIELNDLQKKVLTAAILADIQSVILNTEDVIQTLERQENFNKIRDAMVAAGRLRKTLENTLGLTLR